MKKATLKQIADIAGVSVTTVHRALNGKGGCSEEMEAQIHRIAESKGYSTNLAASSLRKRPFQIAMIFPFRDNGGRFGLDGILDGYLEFRREVGEFNIVFQEFLLRSSDEKPEEYLDMEYPELERILHQICMEQPVRYDGVIIYGMSVTRRAEALLNRIVGRGTKVVVLERRLPSMEDVCTVKADAVMAGDMAAEIFGTQVKRPGTIAVISQRVPGGDISAETCIRQMTEQIPWIKVAQLPLAMNVDQGEAIADFLKQYPDLVGVYITSGRHTCSAIAALKQIDIADLQVIGSELFAESYQALHEHRMTVVLDKRPQKIGYTAVQMLTGNLLKGRPLPQIRQIPPRLIIRSNSDVHFVKREYQHELEQYSD